MRGSRSRTFATFLNLGIGPLGRSAVPADCGRRIFLGDLTSRPKTAFNCAVADAG